MSSTSPAPRRLLLSWKEVRPEPEEDYPATDSVSDSGQVGPDGRGVLVTW